MDYCDLSFRYSIRSFVINSCWFAFHFHLNLDVLSISNTAEVLQAQSG